MKSKLKTMALALTVVFAISCQNKGSSYSNLNNPNGDGPFPVNLGSLDNSNPDLGAAGGYVILAKTGISNTGTSAIVGNMGVSPIDYTAITGFALSPVSPDASTTYATSAQVDGKIYASDYAPPTPSNLTTAIGSMETAYTDAAGRVNPDFTELASGNLAGRTLTPGLYKWGTNVIIPSAVYLSGAPNDVWIFQIAGDLSMAAGVQVILLGGARPENIFWQVAGQVDLNSTSHFEGILLVKTAVNFVTGATMNGRIFSQTAVALDDNDITQP